MEAFYQESGRAGRDQSPSRSVLYYGMDDRRRMVGPPSWTLARDIFFNRFPTRNLIETFTKFVSGIYFE